MSVWVICGQSDRSSTNVRQEFEMASQTASPLRAGQVLEISFPTFTPRITLTAS